MNNSIAKFLSAVFHPLLMPSYLFGIIFYFAPYYVINLESFNNSAMVGVMTLKQGLLLLIFMLTFIVPAFIVFALYRFGFIKTLTMQTLKDRHLPYLSTVLVYTFVSIFFTKNITQLPEVALLLSAITFSVAAVAAISLYWKISAHAVGASGLVGSLIGILLLYHDPYLLSPTIMAILLTGMILSARLHLNAHNIEQITLGTLLGFTISIFVVLKFS